MICTIYIFGFNGFICTILELLELNFFSNFSSILIPTFLAKCTFSRWDCSRSLPIVYQYVRAPFLAMENIAQNDLVLLQLPSYLWKVPACNIQGPLRPFWLLLIAIFLNLLIASWHSFICVAWSLVLPLCLVSLNYVLLDLCISLIPPFHHLWVLLL